MNKDIKNDNVPRGFESGPTDQVAFKAADMQRDRTRVNFRGPGRGGPPGRGQTFEKPKEGKRTVARLLRYFSTERVLLILLIVSVLAVTGASLAAPVLQGNAVDYIKGIFDLNSAEIPDSDLVAIEWEKLCVTLAVMLAVYLINVGFSLAQSLFSANLSQRIVRKMRHDLFEKIDRLSIKYLDTHSNGDVMSRMTNDIENVSNTVSQSLGSLVSGVLTVIGTVVIMFVYCWQLTLITMLTVVLTLAVTKLLSKVMRKIFRRRSEVLGQLNGHSEEMITGYRSIVACNKQDDVIAEFNRTSDELTSVGIKAEILGGSMGPIMNGISNVGFVIVAAFGGYFALPSVGIISVGMISMFIIFAKQFSRPINEIAQLYGSLQTALAGAERIFEILDQPNEDDSGEREMTDVRGEISFRNVNFSYVPGKQVLYDFNLDVRPGQKIALVGATGSGKTTVVNLLMRFYPVDSGEILIDGVNIADLKRDDLRHNTAIVLQDTVLFSDTVGNNIKYARPDASYEETVRAAEMSNSAHFIDKLPQGYDTQLRQAGANLSQGQRQLLAIARAILADPKILILDEATSSVDTRTEKNIQDAMVNLMKNRTSLIIAHRLSTVRDADVIVVMDQGHVVEVGNHDQLLALKGTYYNLYMTQFAGNRT